MAKTAYRRTVSPEPAPAQAQNPSILYKGYAVAPVAQPLPDGLFAASLVIKNLATRAGRAWSFDALDYFFDEEHALAYAARWARMWVDDRRDTRACA